MFALKTTLAATLFGLIAAGSAFAHDPRPIDRTQDWQLQQIEQGRRNGSITRREYSALIAEQARIAEMERRALADGRLTGREVRTIREAQRDAQNHIYTESQDREVNVWRRWKARHGY